jgi:1,4-dihydroxy-2-naphthoate polyprenyltransferase
MPPVEPSLPALSNPFLRYFLATRPPFLSVTLFACMVGLASASYTGVALNMAAAAATILFALVAHAGINVLNDYYDELSGTDRLNTDRVFPYTGGSRFIQNGVLTLNETLVFGIALIVLVVAAGLWLTAISAPGLVWIGAAGLFIGWAYSAPPAKLNSRGVGELCVALGFGLIVVGSDYVQRGGFSWFPVIAAVCYALLVTNILYINQFPDRRADEAAGKHHWVVRLGPGRARWGYVAIASAGYGWIVFAVMAGMLPAWTLIALLPAAMSFKAAGILLVHPDQPRELTPAIQMTIGAASAHGFLMAAALVVSRAIG